MNYYTTLVTLCQVSLVIEIKYEILDLIKYPLTALLFFVK